jgi:hypothetical protein
MTAGGGNANDVCQQQTGQDILRLIDAHDLCSDFVTLWSQSELRRKSEVRRLFEL